MEYILIREIAYGIGSPNDPFQVGGRKSIKPGTIIENPVFENGKAIFSIDGHEFKISAKLVREFK